MANEIVEQVKKIVEETRSREAYRANAEGIARRQQIQADEAERERAKTADL